MILPLGEYANDIVIVPPLSSPTKKSISYLILNDVHSLVYISFA